jgi:uncharacterized repeat protein (TIGR01451 family)
MSHLVVGLRLKRRLSLLAFAVIAISAGPAAGSAFAWTLTKSVRDITHPSATSPAGSFADGLSASPGDTLEYQLVYEATGSGTVTGVSVTDPVPDHSTFLSCSQGCTTTGSTPGSTITWSLPDQNGPSSVTVTFQTQLDSAIPAGTSIRNVGTAFTHEEPPNQSNQVTVTIGACPATGPNPDAANASGKANGAIINAPILGIKQTLSPTSSTQHGLGVDSHNNNLANIKLPNDGSVANVGLLTTTSTSEVSGSPPQADNLSTAQTASVKLLNNAVTGPLVSADLVRASAEATADGASASTSSAGSEIKGLKIQGVAINTVTPNETINLVPQLLGLNVVTGYVKIDEEVPSISTPVAGQLSGGTYAANLTVNMIHVHLSLQPLLGQSAVVDIIVSQATAHADFPQTPVCAGAHPQAVSGHAFIASESTDPTLVSVLSGYVAIAPTGGSASQHLDAFDVSPLASGSAADTASSGTLGASSSDAKSSAAIVKGVCVLLSAGKCVISADAITSDSASTAGGGAASSNDTGTTFVNLVVNGTPIGGTPPPNTTITLPNIGFVVLNEQTCDGGSAATHTCTGTTHSGLTVRAIHVVVTKNALGLLPGVDVIVSEAHSDATFGL